MAIDKRVMDAMAEEADLLLRARGPLYEMSNHEAEAKLRELQKEEGMEKVYVCSQYGSRGDMATNLELAKAYCMAVIEEGKIPVCPHLFLAGVLNDEISSQRAAGIKIGLELLKDCNELRVFSLLSEGMKGEISAAKEQGIPVSVADLSCIYSEEKRAEVEEEIEADLRRYWDGKEHHSEEN